MKEALAAAERMEDGATEEIGRLCAVNGLHKNRVAELRALGVVSVEVQREVSCAVLAPGLAGAGVLLARGLSGGVVSRVERGVCGGRDGAEHRGGGAAGGRWLPVWHRSA